MKVSIINGSQKTGESNTGIILNHLYGIIKEKHEVNMFNSGKKFFSNETLIEIISGDVLVFWVFLFLFILFLQIL